MSSQIRTLLRKAAMKVVRPHIANIDSLQSEVFDCSPPAVNQSGASHVNGIERMGRAGGVVAEAAGPFRSQVYRFGSLETREAAEEILAAWIDAR